MLLLSGRGGIRTPGGVTHAGFQDRCIKPALPLFLVALFLSDAKVTNVISNDQIFGHKKENKKASSLLNLLLEKLNFRYN
jgi:hypothetical protein